MAFKPNNIYQMFCDSMLQFGTFEKTPEVAVAVSGGGDSMGLLLLVDKWAKERGGRALALSVDHGLRESSNIELQQVSKWLKKREIEHYILEWCAKKKQVLKKKQG